MPIWTYPYILLLMVLTAASTAVKRRLGFPGWWVTLDVLSIAVLLWLLVSYHRPGALGALADASPAVYAAALAWLGISTHRELAVVERLPIAESEHSSKAQWISLIGGLLLLTPAIGLGAIAVARAWQG